MPEEAKPTTPEKVTKLTFTEETPVVTKQQVMIGGKLRDVTVTTGRLPIKDQFGTIEAQIFFMAYTLDGAEPGDRPLMFSFNGGPGSPSIWLHLGALGPKRIPMKNDGEQPEPPYALIENSATWLEFTDLVFIDPVGTGFSQAVDEATAEKFWSVSGDIESMSEFIRLYLSRNQRYSSPLYLVGESYGTTRAAGISKYLVERGVAFNGVVLVSSAMSFLTLDFVQSSDLPHVLFLPTYAATAWYHGALGRGRTPNLSKFLKSVEKFAAGEYLQVLLKGDTASPVEMKRVATKLSKFTGLSVDYLLKRKLRIEIMGFCKELLRNKGLTVGRLDSRITGYDADQTTYGLEHDPAMSALFPPYVMAFSDYVSRELGYKTDLQYHVFYGITKPWKWDLPKDEPTDTSHALRDALLRNPYMKVFVASGYYDLATPYFATEYSLSHMGLPPNIRQNIVTFEYPAGHMMYTHEESLSRLQKEVHDWIKS